MTNKQISLTKTKRVFRSAILREKLEYVLSRYSHVHFDKDDFEDDESLTNMFIDDLMRFIEDKEKFLKEIGYYKAIAADIYKKR